MENSFSMRVNFISSRDTGETRTIHMSDNENIIQGSETDNIIKNLSESFLDNYQKEKQITGGGSGFAFESVELMDYKLHKTSLKRSRSYIESPAWLKNKGARINPRNKKDNKCFQYALKYRKNIKN